MKQEETRTTPNRLIALSIHGVSSNQNTTRSCVKFVFPQTSRHVVSKTVALSVYPLDSRPAAVYDKCLARHETGSIRSQKK